MSGSGCTGTPVSWLALEQFHLGELPDNRAKEIEKHLNECDLCLSYMDEIVNDNIVLKPLPDIEHEHWFAELLLNPAGAGGLVALAVMLMIAVLLRPVTETVSVDNSQIIPGSLIPPAHMNYKGGDLAISLERNRSGRVTLNPHAFADGDRFAVNVTCPPGSLDIELVVFQGGEAYFPLNINESVECANLVPLSGGFVLSGNEPATVCIIAGEIPARSEIEQSGPEELPEFSVCRRLKAIKGANPPY
jgi:hypothetical protein